jgi:hypothetical protein
LNDDYVISVKGGIQRVEGNRVYLRVEKENLTEEELYKLIAYLDRKIAAVCPPPLSLSQIGICSV